MLSKNMDGITAMGHGSMVDIDTNFPEMGDRDGVRS